MVEVKIKGPAYPDEGHFDKHQPAAAREKVAADLAGLPARDIEKRGYAGQQYESRCAEVRDPAGQKQCRVGDVARIETTCCEKVARVIKRHHHHDQTAQKVDRDKPCVAGDLCRLYPLRRRPGGRKRRRAQSFQREFHESWLRRFSPILATEEAYMPNPASMQSAC